jgi:hypothetical protein
MDQKQFDALLSEAETRLRRLKVLYEQWFMGIERLEPSLARKEFEDLLARMRKEQTNNTAQRFRLQQLVQRHVALSTHWRRIGRQIEEGTYQRDVLRAKRRKQHGQARESDDPDVDVSFDVDVDEDLAAALAEADRLAHEPPAPEAYPAPLAAAKRGGGTQPGVAPGVVAAEAYSSMRPPLQQDLGAQHSLTPFAVPGTNPARSRSIAPSAPGAPPPLTAAVARAASAPGDAPPLAAKGVGRTSVVQAAGPGAAAQGGPPALPPGVGRSSVVHGPPAMPPGVGRSAVVQAAGTAAAVSGSPGVSAPGVGRASIAQGAAAAAASGGAPVSAPGVGRGSISQGAGATGAAAGGAGVSAPGVGRSSVVQNAGGGAAAGGVSARGSIAQAGAPPAASGAGGPPSLQPSASKGIGRSSQAGVALGGGHAGPAVSAPGVGRTSGVLSGGAAAPAAGRSSVVHGAPASSGRPGTVPGVGPSVAQGSHAGVPVTPSAAKSSVVQPSGPAGAGAAGTGARAPMSGNEAFGAAGGGRPAVQRPAAAAARPAQPRPTTSAAASGGAFSSQDVDRVYSQYVAARGKNAERIDNVKRETLEKTIRTMLPGLEQKHAGKRIDFEVVVKDGKVALKPVAK